MFPLGCSTEANAGVAFVSSQNMVLLGTENMMEYRMTTAPAEEEMLPTDEYFRVIIRKHRNCSNCKDNHR